MLPRRYRLRSSEDFRRTSRRGVRVGRSTVVVHASTRQRDADAGDGVRVGLVVGRAIGGAVVRNRVKRRLRHLVAGRLGSTPAGTDVVVRALPAAALHPTALGPDLDSAWSAAMSALQRRVSWDRREPSGFGRRAEVSP